MCPDCVRQLSDLFVRSDYHPEPMVESKRAAGSPVVEMTDEEYADFVEREVRGAVGMSPDEFRRAYLAGELDDSNPAVSELVGFLRIGQNGHAAAA
jgi:hypothetical protein